MMLCRKLAGLSLVFLLWASALLGCAEEMGDIDRTQANRIKKSDLQGTEWYFGQTVLKNPVTSGFTMELYGGSLERVRFVIDEKYLLVYRSYEYIPGTDDRQDAAGYKGEILAAYRIESHFDVLREYNPTTGEETNVISENSSDRQWWEREYIRVDWSQNLAPSIDPNYEWFTWHVFNISHVAPLAYFVQDTPEAEADPDRADFDFARGELSFVNRYAVRPDIDECLNYVFFQFECGTAEVKVRNIFQRIDGPSGYEPLEYRDTLPLTWDDGRPIQTEFSNARGGVVACDPDTHPYDNQTYCYPEELPVWNMFGLLRTDISGKPVWDERRGATWETRQQRAIRHNIWERARDDQGKLIPYAQRVPRPIVWVLDWDYPEELKPTAQAAVDKWNAVFMRLLRELDHPKAKEPGFRMVVLRDNACSPKSLNAYLGLHPELRRVAQRVLGADSTKKPEELSLEQRTSLCAALDYNTRGKADHFTWEKQGQLGIHILQWINHYQIGMPLGMMMPWNDPVTGEMIHTYASVWNASLAPYVSRAADIVDVLNDRLALEDVLYGVNVREELHGRTRDDRAEEEGGGGQQKRQNLVASHMQAMQQRLREMQRTPTSDEVLRELNSRFTQLGRQPEELLQQVPAGWGRGLLERIRGTELERRLVSDEMLMAFNPGWRPGDPLDDQMVERASPLTWLYGKGREQYEERLRRAARYHVELSDFVEDRVIGLALQLKDLSREELYRRLYHDVYEAVLLHEMGHAFGLEHNYEATMDALNYIDGYWDIRTRTEQEAAEHGWDEARLREEQNKLRLPEYQYSSIMDYSAQFNTDFQGLGKWDEAAILFGYGNLIEVWDDDLALDLDSDPLKNAKQEYYNLSSAIFLRTADHLVELMGGDPANIRRRHTVDFDEYVQKYRDALIASFVPDKQGQLGPPVQERVVPYQFCEDTYAGPPGGYPSCAMWDSGSTMVEKVRDISSYYRNFYYWNNFRRDAFDDYAFFNNFVYRLYYRTFDPLITMFKYFFFYRAIVGQALIDPTEAQGIEFGRDYARAAIEGLNLLSEVLQTPDFGRYCLGTQETERYDECDAGEFCPERYFEDCQAAGLEQVEIPFGIGRKPFFDFSNDLWFKFDVIGSIFEKELAIMALTDTMSVFYGMDFTSNFGTFEINPYRLFQQELVDLFTGLITSQNEYFSGVLEVEQPAEEEEFPDYSLGSFRPRLLIDPGKRYPEGFTTTESLDGLPLVDGMTNFTIAFYGALFGIGMMSSPFDGAENFSNYTRIVLAGSGDDYLDGVPAELREGRICTFTDPKTLFTYRALQTLDGRSVACLLMARAQKVLDGVELDGQMQGGWFDAKATYEARKMSYERNPNNSGTYKLYADAKAEFERIDIRLNRWIDRIVMLRDIQAVFEPGR